MLKLFSEKHLLPPPFEGVTLEVRRSRSERWPVQYDIQRVVMHARAAEHEEQVKQWLLSAGAVLGDAAALVCDSTTLRLRHAGDVWARVIPHLDAVTLRYAWCEGGEHRRSIWTYYAGLRCAMKQPHPEVTTLAIEYLEAADDVSTFDVGTVAAHCAEVRAQYDNLAATLKQVFADAVVQTETEPWPLWDKSRAWLGARFWQWVYRESAKGKTQTQLFAQAGVTRDEAYGWRKNALAVLKDDDLHINPEHDMPTLDTLVEALQRSVSK